MSFDPLTPPILLVPRTMNALGKVLVVLVVATSLAFLGFVAVMLVGGPNWGAERVALINEGYSFNKSEGEVVQWSARYGNDADSSKNETVGSSTTIEPVAVISARKHMKNRLQQEITKLSEENPRLQQEMEVIRNLIQVDMDAILNRRASLQKEVEALRGEHGMVADRIDAKARAGWEKQKEVMARRHDVYRIWEQLEELEADTARIRDERKLLEDRLTILEGDNRRLTSRKDRMEKRLGTTPEPGNE